MEKKEDISGYLKNYGFFVSNAEIYQGSAKFWDLGSNGNSLKKNLKNLWWKYFISSNILNVGSDSCIITNPKVLEASGHSKNFCD
jgi:glycyl-tRNA synthetase (class II)